MVPSWLSDRPEDLLPDPGQVEDALGDDRAAHQLPEIDAEQRDDRNQELRNV